MKRVLVLLADGFEGLEAAAFVDVLGWANDFGSEPIEIVTAALHERLRCTWALEVIPMRGLEEISVDEFDALAVPGGFERAGFFGDAYSPQFLDLIRRFAQQDKLLASICVGALPLGKSGVLRGRRATTYHLLGDRKSGV